ncbi:MAG: cyclic pyranopterin monophosphate synthase, partial [Caulobacteraceae bacterium]
MSKLSHLDEAGRARMVDVSGKPPTAREAVAEGFVRMRKETLELALSGHSKKGEVIAPAELAGVMAAKKTADLIPLCHPLPLTGVKVEIVPTA